MKTVFGSVFDRFGSEAEKAAWKAANAGSVQERVN